MRESLIHEALLEAINIVKHEVLKTGIELDPAKARC
jgi:hypothetical protein